MKMIDVASQNIAQIGWEQGGTLFIKFHYRNRLYRYFLVPKAVFEEFLSAKSKGRYFSEAIDGQYECELVEGAA